MAVTRVGSASTGGTNSSATHVTSFPQTPTAGNTLLLTVAVGGGGAFPTATINQGWTRLGSAGIANGGANGGVHFFGKIATASETAPTVTLSHAGNNSSWTLEEWSGLAATLPTTGIPKTGTSNTSLTTVSDSYTSAVANEWVYAALGCRGAFTSLAWGTGLTSSSGATVGSVVEVQVATGSIASAGGSLTGSPTFVNSQGDRGNGLILQGFAQGGTAHTGDVSQTITATITSTGTRNKNADTSQTVTAATTAATVKGQTADSTLTNTATITSSGVKGMSVASTLTATAGIAAAAVLGMSAATSLPVTTDITAAAVTNRNADAQLTATATITADATVTSGAQADAALTASTNITADATRDANTQSSTTVTATTTGAGTVGKSAASTLPVVAGFTVDASTGRVAATSRAIAATITVDANVVPVGFETPRQPSALITSASSYAIITNPNAKAVIT